MIFGFFLCLLRI